ncbi:uncharacterized protein PGTG_20352 [Puccinia graminis f. sp. tritici CRL 75-36-700-3]|uniref:Uncharacterized protein n=1 Tax=Puccinia graminis f. sp. tritici (strain CRL 75-36-700-3 / race SCCL) TaxID=418459 RepID=E3NXU7_PUCGT|nr:uncharacterized protein PGTG_20352 [Puccinia graminis f. sp. tritici CRL 75-36-700-3]EFP94396.1 hypothetical protein PGTG_20352 [Puccinia graminis f. sp. tritici CRL 75-36-700-3]
MTALRAPNHPSILTGLFEPTANSIPEAQRGNQYGVLNTPSFFQCAGYMNQQLTDFEVILVTNTALNNVLEAGACYLISGRLISLNDGSTPTLTYNHDTVVRIAGPGTSGPELTNRTSAVGLGHVVERAEVLAGEADGGPRLEVVVAHNNWDAIVPSTAWGVPFTPAPHPSGGARYLGTATGTPSLPYQNDGGLLLQELQEGTLATWKQGLKDNKKSNQKSKRKVIVLDNDEDSSN